VAVPCFQQEVLRFAYEVVVVAISVVAERDREEIMDMKTWMEHQQL